MGKEEKSKVVDKEKLEKISKSTNNEDLKKSIDQKLKYVNKPINK